MHGWGTSSVSLHYVSCLSGNKPIHHLSAFKHGKPGNFKHLCSWLDVYSLSICYSCYSYVIVILVICSYSYVECYGECYLYKWLLRLLIAMLHLICMHCLPPYTHFSFSSVDNDLDYFYYCSILNSCDSIFTSCNKVLANVV